MEQNKNQYSLADMRAYLMDELPEGERKAIESAMQTDPLLAGAMEVLEEEFGKKSLDEAQLNQLTASFRQAIPGDKNGKHSTISIRRRPIGPQIQRFAAVILLFAAGIWALSYLTARKAGPEDVFAENFRPYEDVISSRSLGDTDGLLRESMEHYKAGSYEQALTGFNSILLQDEKEPFALLYAANSALTLGKTQEAIALLQRLDALQNPVLQDVSRWYLALAYLRMGEKEKASDLFQYLIETESAFQSQAGKVYSR